MWYSRPTNPSVYGDLLLHTELMYIGDKFAAEDIAARDKFIDTSSLILN